MKFFVYGGCAFLLLSSCVSRKALKAEQAKYGRLNEYYIQVQTDLKKCRDEEAEAARQPLSTGVGAGLRTPANGTAKRGKQRDGKPAQGPFCNQLSTAAPASSFCLNSTSSSNCWKNLKANAELLTSSYG